VVSLEPPKPPLAADGAGIVLRKLYGMGAPRLKRTLDCLKEENMARICLVVLLFGLCDPSSVAQVEVGHVAGQVVLYNGVPVEGADVRFFLLDGVRGLPTKETLVREVKTDHQGKYEVRELPAGSYRVVVELLGYGNNEVWRFYVWRGAERWFRSRACARDDPRPRNSLGQRQSHCPVWTADCGRHGNACECPRCR
jgi:hypothetical protein